MNQRDESLLVFGVLIAVLLVNTTNLWGEPPAGERPLEQLQEDEIAAMAGTISADTFGPKGDTFGKKIDEALKSDPIASNGVRATHADVSYGDHERNMLDLWLTESPQPTPLVVFIHGGGFRRGDKSLLYDSNTLVMLLEAGFSVAGVNYRFSHQSQQGTLGSLRDVARAIQFLRYHADKYHLDAERVACYGGSAGGAASLWLAFHDDLADPSSDDLIARESTRLTCAAGMATPATLDLVQWKSILGITHERMVAAAKTFGVKDEATLYSPEVEQQRQATDFLVMMSPDDPPVFIHNSESGEVPQHVGHMAHHPNHAKILQQRAQEVGIETVVLAPQIGISDPSGHNLVSFFVKHLAPSESR